VVQQPVSGVADAGSGGGGDQNGSGAGGSQPANRPDRATPAIGSSSGLDLAALISGAIKDAYAPDTRDPVIKAQQDATAAENIRNGAGRKRTGAV